MTDRIHKQEEQREKKALNTRFTHAHMQGGENVWRCMNSMAHADPVPLLTTSHNMRRRGACGGEQANGVDVVKG